MRQAWPGATRLEGICHGSLRSPHYRTCHRPGGIVDSGDLLRIVGNVGPGLFSSLLGVSPSHAVLEQRIATVVSAVSAPDAHAPDPLDLPSAPPPASHTPHVIRPHDVGFLHQHRSAELRNASRSVSARGSVARSPSSWAAQRSQAPTAGSRQRFCGAAGGEELSDAATVLRPA